MRKKGGILLLAVCGFLAPVGRAHEDTVSRQRAWNAEVIYFVLTDRFLDGDPSNNIPPGSDPALYDPTQTNINRYHGGDLRGLELALQAGYFNQLGITALWITPPVRNVWNSPYDDGHDSKTGYHGYWTQDFLDIDPHLVSRRSLDGSKDYPDSPEGRLQHYRDFVALAHSKGIRIIQDIVLNHAGQVFHYDANRNGQLDHDAPEEWIHPFNPEGVKAEARWAKIPEWNLHQTQPDGPRKLLGHDIPTSGLLANLATYSRKGMSKDSLISADPTTPLVCDFFALRDIDTAPDSPHFEQLVREFIEIYAFYAEAVGVDGFRIDTVVHVHHAFWDAFTEGLRNRLSPKKAASFLLLGEVYNGDPAVLGSFTYRSDWPKRKDTCLDSVFDFAYCFGLRNALRPEHRLTASPRAFEAALLSTAPTPPPGHHRPYYNQTPGLDGLNSSQKSVKFFENHDGLNRFLVGDMDPAINRLANALLLATPGIPCLYYGTENDLRDPAGKPGLNAETGRRTLFRTGDTHALTEAMQHPAFKNIARMAKLRRKFPALAAGSIHPLWLDSPESSDDDSVFAFACATEGEDTIIVVANAGNTLRNAGIAQHPLRLLTISGKPLLNASQHLEPVLWADDNHMAARPEPIAPDWRSGMPQAILPAAPASVTLYKITP